MNVKNILVIHTLPSFNDLQGKEALDLSLIFGSYEQSVKVMFLGQGVFQTLAHQDPESIGQKDYLSTIKALEIYDIEEVYACRASLQQYGFDQHELIDGVQLASQQQLNALKQAADHVYVI